jgi:hypothetical protein
MPCRSDREARAQQRREGAGRPRRDTAPDSTPTTRRDVRCRRSSGPTPSTSSHPPSSGAGSYRSPSAALPDAWRHPACAPGASAASRGVRASSGRCHPLSQPGPASVAGIDRPGMRREPPCSRRRPRRRTANSQRPASAILVARLTKPAHRTSRPPRTGTGIPRCLRGRATRAAATIATTVRPHGAPSCGGWPAGPPTACVLEACSPASWWCRPAGAVSKGRLAARIGCRRHPARTIPPPG